MSNNVITGSDLSSEVSLWDLPIVKEGEATRIISKIKTEVLLPTAEDIEEIQTQARKEAYDEAFEKAKLEGFEQGKKEGVQKGKEEGKEKGYAVGLAEGKAVIDEQFSQFSTLISALNYPLEQLDNEVEEELVNLAMMVARHLIRRELKLEPAHVIAAIRQAVEILPIGTRNITVFLHPDDATLVRESLAVVNDDEQRWKIVEDPMLSRGGCKIETEYSRIDASVEARLNNVITQVLGGERETDTLSAPNVGDQARDDQARDDQESSDAQDSTST